MIKEEVFSKINEWEEENGESFVDYFNSDIHALTYMSWCLGRGHITPEKFDLWAEAYNANNLEAEDPNYFVYNAEDHRGDVPFAVVISAEWNREDQDKAYGILAEFISEMKVYVGRLKAFLAEAENPEAIE